MTMGDRVALMRFGVLQQLGPPRTLYDHPDNMFVAGFIGSPPMNFLRAELVAAATGPAIVAGPLRLPLPPEVLTRRPGLAAQVGRPVMLGFRPEALVPGNPAVEGGLKGTVAFVEDFGAMRLVHLDVEAGAYLTEVAAEADEVALSAPRLRALIDGAHSVARGEPLSVGLDPMQMHFFDPDTELAIRG